MTNNQSLAVQHKIEDALRNRPIWEQYPELKSIFEKTDKQIAKTQKQIEATSKALKGFFESLEEGTEVWQRNFNSVLEVQLLQTVHDFEKAEAMKNNAKKPGPIWPSRVISGDDGNPQCEVDGHFRLGDGTWVVIEAKHHLNQKSWISATTTVSRFEAFIKEVPDLEAHEFDHRDYKNCIELYKQALDKNPCTNVKYLGYRDITRIRFKPDPMTFVKRRGFNLVRPKPGTDLFEVIP